MSKINYYFEGDKDKRKKFAIEHTKEMENKYKEEILKSYNNTIVYGYGKDPWWKNKSQRKMNIEVLPIGVVDAIFTCKDGATAVLNFASYKNPGGMFLNGSRAQEECLCSESFLFNVLSRFKDTYYKNNLSHLNYALYENKALYTPCVYFERDEYLIETCDVITCAAPNATTFYRYHPKDVDKNSKALRSRIKYVLDIASRHNVQTLILGAYGCGVFGQHPLEVAKIFKEELKYRWFENVIFAVPDGFHVDNYRTFKYIFEE
jgi:uncharacterized protein (TIGR02452 family)